MGVDYGASAGRPHPQAQQLVAELTRGHLTIATAESLTAGLISAGLADVPGASAVLTGGAVTYATNRKASVLGVSQELLAQRGAVDAQVAREMAQGALRLFDANLAVSATGVAGPTEQDGHRVGTVFIGCAWTPGVSRTVNAEADASGPCRTDVPRARAHSPVAQHAGEHRDASVRWSVREFHFDGDRATIRSQSAVAAWRLALDAIAGADIAGNDIA